VETATTRPTRPPLVPERATPDPPPAARLARPAAGQPPASQRLRSTAAVALACSGLVLGPALWLGPAAWASSAGLAPLAVPLGTLGLLAAAVSALLTVLGAGRHARERRAPGADRFGPAGVQELAVPLPAR
jgi:hypothetical protein